jgi:hypothetical protein
MGAEDAAAYTAKHSVKQTIAELLDNCCRDTPEELTPYLVAKLTEKVPAAAKSIEIPPEASAWKSSKVPVYTQAQLKQYLEDIRWGPTLAAVMERVLYSRPKNALAFMIELLVKGDVAAPDTGEEAAQAELDEAAARLQAIQRGRKSRKERREQADAATKVQAARRGSSSRKAAQAKRKDREEENGAATKMQARQRGRNARKNKAVGAADASEQIEAAEAEAQEAQEEADAMAYLAEDPQAAASATKMQAMQRGRQARKEKEEQAEAATKMQSRQRGRQARKK